MNVTLNLPADLVRNARHQAVSQSKTLSAWMATLVQRELTSSQLATGRTLIDAFNGDAEDEFLERDFPLEDRKTIPNREFTFASGED